jgi:hypothetical protein
MAALAILALLATGCAVERVPSDTMPLRLSADLSFTCGDMTFPAATLANPLGAEGADTPAAEALRVALRGRDARLEDMPKTAYRILFATDARVVFAASVPTESGLATITILRNADRWAMAGVGTCRPLLSLPGLNAATWRLRVDAPLPGLDATSFDALVTESACTSGRAADGRLLAPAIVREPTRLLVVFAAVPPPPAFGNAESCPGNPPTTYRVELGAPLGNRELLDGGVFPPRGVENPSCCG